IASIVSLARHSGMKTVAEFIFNETIAREITLLGVDYGQGYFLRQAGGKTCLYLATACCITGLKNIKNFLRIKIVFVFVLL
ncbi:MAG: hypothetical protein LRY51_08990, partial [Geovibrio sp.]|nr:hypothetical protein [Geovibrio sp.]